MARKTSVQVRPSHLQPPLELRLEAVADSALTPQVVSRLRLLTFPALSACSRGVDLVRIEVIPDDVQEIKDTVLQLKKRVGAGGVVFTSGGIGQGLTSSILR